MIFLKTSLKSTIKRYLLVLVLATFAALVSWIVCKNKKTESWTDGMRQMISWSICIWQMICILYLVFCILKLYLYLPSKTKKKELKVGQREGDERWAGQVVFVFCVLYFEIVFLFWNCICICPQKLKRKSWKLDRERETSDELVRVLWHHLQFCPAHSVTST